MSLFFHSLSRREREDTLKDSPSNVGLTGLQDTSAIGISIRNANVKSHSHLQGEGRRREMAKEIADLVGERFTVRARLEWLEVRLKTLQDQLRDLNR